MNHQLSHILPTTHHHERISHEQQYALRPYTPVLQIAPKLHEV